MSESTSQKKKISRDTAESMSGELCSWFSMAVIQLKDIFRQLNNQTTKQQDNRANHKESKKGRMADALAHGGEEGRDKLR